MHPQQFAAPDHYAAQPPTYGYPVSGVPMSPATPYGQQYSPQAVYQQPVYQQVVVAPAAPTSGWATASMVLGILGALGGWCMLGIPCFVAIVAGHAGLIDTKNGSKGGRGLAVTGLVLGYVFIVPWALFFFLGGLGVATPDVSPTPTP
ncbi:DUF4190 domain-containing protein [Pseudosporangium ferrugineum]|nr:DUF4190 domain-containing protein [Pseudosporangium ferrugineum]